jgi:hypothetical protein
LYQFLFECLKCKICIHLLISVYNILEIPFNIVPPLEKQGSLSIFLLCEECEVLSPWVLMIERDGIWDSLECLLYIFILFVEGCELIEVGLDAESEVVKVGLDQSVL